MFLQSDFCLRSLRGFGLAIVLLLGSSGEMAWAESPFHEAAPYHTFPNIGLPGGESWPTIGWSLQQATPETKVSALMPDASTAVFTLPSGPEGVSIQFRDPEMIDLGPIVDLSKPLPKASQTVAKANQSESALEPWQVGNGSFNRMAQSFNLGKSDVVLKDDLSRQLGKVAGSPNVAASAPITGWAIAGIAVLVVLVAMTVAHFENDKDDRKRRKKVRRRKHRHSS